MDPRLRAAAERTRGFMPPAEGLLLYSAGLEAAQVGPLLEIGSYCGKSAIYLGAAARARATILFSIDHHRGSEEQQPGQPYHDPDLVDSNRRVDSLPCFRQSIAEAGLEEVVVSIVGRSATVASRWATPLSLVFIDGGHSQSAVEMDFDAWACQLSVGGLLAIHDVFPNPADGGRHP